MVSFFQQPRMSETTAPVVKIEGQAQQSTFRSMPGEKESISNTSKSDMKEIVVTPSLLPLDDESDISVVPKRRVV